jgi:cation diffusion facilitator CzcD-associated flavoprotein CzcO
MIDWLIIGGGLHGTHLSLVLTKDHGVDARRLRVLDPEPEPLANWFHQTRNTGMTHLRSPVVHHIDLEPGSLRKFSNKWREAKRFIAPYGRPSLAMFNAHCRAVIDRHQLAQPRIQGKARHIGIAKDHVFVETTAGLIRSRRVIMAIGPTAPEFPDWATRLRADGARIDHLFGADFAGPEMKATGTTLVVGGGISGAQFACRLVEQGAEEVVLLARSQPRVHQFDADPGWLGPKNMNRFDTLEIAAKRSAIIAARHRVRCPAMSPAVSVLI